MLKMKKSNTSLVFFYLSLAANTIFAQFHPLKNCHAEEAGRLLAKAKTMLAGNSWNGAFDTAFIATTYMKDCPPDVLLTTWLREWSDFMRLSDNTRKESAGILAEFARQFPDTAAAKAELLLRAADHLIALPQKESGYEYIAQANKILTSRHRDNKWLLALYYFVQASYANTSRKPSPEGLSHIDSALLLMEEIGWQETLIAGRMRQTRSFLLYHSKKWDESFAETRQALDLLAKKGTAKHRYEIEDFYAGLFRISGQPEKAVSVRRETDKWLRNTPSFFRNTFRPALLNSLGIDLKNSGRYTEAKKCYEEALAILDRDGPPKRLEADLETNLGVIYQRKGQLKEGLLHIRRGLDIIVRIYGADSNEAAKRYANLAVNYRLAGDLERGEEYALKCIPIWQKTEVAPELLFSPYATLFDIAVDRGDSASRELWLAEIEKCFDASPKSVRPHMWMGYALMLGLHWSKSGRADEAVQVIDSLLRRYPPPAGDFVPQQWTDARSALAYAKFQSGDLEGSAHEFAAAWRNTFYQKGGQFRYISRNSFERIGLQTAEVYLNQFSLSPKQIYRDSAIFFQNIAMHSMLEKALSAEKVYMETDEHFSTINVSTGIANCKKLYRFTRDVRWLKNAVDLAEATAVQNLRRYLREHPGLAINGLTEESLNAESDLRVLIAEAEMNEFKALIEADNNLADTGYLAHAARLLLLDKQYDSLRQEMMQANPGFHRLQFTLPFFGADSIQTRLLHPGQCYFQFFHEASQRRLEVQMLRTDTIVGFSVSTNASFDSALATVQRAVQFPNFGGNESGYIAAARMLYDSLFGRVSPLLTTEIFIAPDAYLSALSFESLLKSQPANPARPHTWQFFGQVHAVSYLSAAALFRYQQLRPLLYPHADIFIGFAPFYSGDTTALAEAFPELGSGLRRDLQPLLYSGSEVAKLAKIAGGRGFYGAEAGKPRFLELASGAKIIHLATHAQANRELGDFSFLAFSDTQKAPAQSLLFARELYNLSLSADMVVLSACETGLGRYGQGEGIAGFSRALTCAGARSLVASQWSVNDRHTQTLMLLFYKELKKGIPKNLALWNAKKSFFKDFKADAAPFFWAAFTLFGDTTPILFK